MHLTEVFACLLTLGLSGLENPYKNTDSDLFKKYLRLNKYEMII